VIRLSPRIKIGILYDDNEATALLFVLQPGGGTRPTTEDRPKSFSNKAKKALDRYLEELGSWSGEGTRTRDLAPEAYAEAPLGWY
jgi:hypothetical protein